MMCWRASPVISPTVLSEGKRALRRWGRCVRLNLVEPVLQVECKVLERVDADDQAGPGELFEPEQRIRDVLVSAMSRVAPEVDHGARHGGVPTPEVLEMRDEACLLRDMPRGKAWQLNTSYAPAE